VIILLLVGLTVTAYWSVGRAGFVNLDDDAYVEFQPMVNQGVRSAAVMWAFSAVHSGNWHPLTTLSHIVDCELFGLRPGAMHWENLAWHSLNSVLVFLIWRLFSGTIWRSALVAALFALHPLHVESVAWISERKDLLSTFFWLLGIGAYTHYTRSPTRRNYLAVATALVLALLSKPMAVTFPCTLLLLDFWPLARWPGKKATALFTEKLPLFALVLAHSVATFIVQHASGAGDFGQGLSLTDRLGNAVVSYVRYLGKTVWPVELSPFYPHPGAWPLSAIIGAIIVLLAASIVAWQQRHRRRWLAFGWLWFLGTLVPVIGIIQVGAQSMADRYTYVPLLGIFTIVAWSGAELIERAPRLRLPLIGAAALSLGTCHWLTQLQVSAWGSSVTLYQRAIANGYDHATIRYLLAVASEAAGAPENIVVEHYRRALKFDPDYINASTQLARIAMRHGKLEEALEHLENNRRRRPSNPDVHLNLGAFCHQLGQHEKALAHLDETLRLAPNHANARLVRSRIFVAQNRLPEAKAELEKCVQLSPWNADAIAELGTINANLRQFDLAKQYLERAIWINPNLAIAHENLRAVKALLEAPR
jgi:tetratricopeptide (TPR) repeat protein